MKTLGWIVGSVFVLFFLGFASKAVFPGLFAPQGAFIDWKEIQSDTFVLQPGAITVGYPVPHQPRYGFKPKIAIEAKSPVTIGYIPESYGAAMASNPASLSKLPIVHYLAIHVLKTTLECDLDTLNSGYVLYIQDERTVGQKAASGMLGVVGMTQPAQQALVRNDVHVDFSAYTCVRNCEQ